MTTLFNTSDFQLTAQEQPKRTRRSADKMSKISHPLAQGSTMYRKAQRALQQTKDEITAIYGTFVLFITEEAYYNGSAQIVIERYEDGESIMYQYDINPDGTYCEYQI